MNVQKGNLVFDIGCHGGLDTVAFLAAGCSVVAVDASFERVQTTRAKVKGNPNLKTVVAAVADKAGVLTFFDNKTEGVWSSIFEEIAGRRKGDVVESTNVVALSLDDLIECFGLPDFIKLDIEGVEWLALQGLSHAPPLLSLEVGHLPVGQPELLAHMANLGFREFAYCPQTSNLSTGWERELDWFPINAVDKATPPTQWVDVYFRI